MTGAFIGYMRASKADGSQAIDLQRDARVAAGMDPAHVYQDQASGKKDDRPGLEACLIALRAGTPWWPGSWTGSGATSGTS